MSTNNNNNRPKRSNKRTRTKAFKSYTDVNNYNNFLIDLDKRHKETPPVKVKPTSEFKRENLKIFVKDIDSDFRRLGCGEQNFCGVNPWELLINSIHKHLEPNSY